MLISEEYRKINNELHVKDAKFGNGVKYDPKDLLKLCDKLDTTDVLDYGCGKGLTAESWGFPFAIKLYDPAIPQYMATPEPAELVLCLDVLEHVEPECLEDVIKDLFRVTKRMGVFLIDTKPSTLILPDGRNAHLSLHTGEEWREKLAKYFDIVFIDKYQENVGITFYVKPRMSLEIFDGIEEKFKDSKEPLNIMQYSMVEFGEWQNVNFYPSYLAYSLSQIDEWFSPENQPVREERAAIVAYGSSLLETIEELRKGHYKYIFTTSGSHDLLIKNGIIPTHHIEIDWKPHKAEFTKNAHPDVTYMVSCTCHPDTINNVKRGKKAVLLFPSHGPQITLPDESYVMPTGYDAGQTCIVVAKIMGFRKMDLFGFDYSFTKDGHRHAGQHGGRVHFKFLARVGDKIFYTSKTMFGALLTMEYLLKNNKDLDVTIFGNALFPNFIEQRKKDSLCLSNST